MIKTLVTAVAIAVGILSGVVTLTEWGHHQWKKLRHFVSRYRPKVPKETLRVIPQYHHIWWSLGSLRSALAMQLVCDFYITNIADVDVLICEVSLRKPKTIGHVFVRHPREDVYGSYPILPHSTTEARADFWIQPPVCKENEPLVADIDFVDQFGNSHRLRKVKFQPRPKKKKDPMAPEVEMVSDISNRVEREVVTVLQAEINRYKDCGRKINNLGSVKLFIRSGHIVESALIGEKQIHRNCKRLCLTLKMQRLNQIMHQRWLSSISL